MRTGEAVMAVKDNEAGLKRAVEAWNSGDVDSYMELYAEDIRLHMGAHDVPDRKAVESMYKGFHAATSDLRLDIHEAVGEGDTLAVRYAVTGTHTGELMGIHPTGREFSIFGITILRFKNGRVVERWDSDDSAEVLGELKGS